jgi:hypothetical protein
LIEDLDFVSARAAAGAPPLRNQKFADSPLEGGGFELPVRGHLSGVTCWSFGDFAGAHDHFQKSIELYDQTRHGDFANRFGWNPRAAAEIFDAIALWVLGRVDEAEPLAERALTDAESAAHAPTMAQALQFAALLGLVRCNPEAVATYGQALADIVSRYDPPAHWVGLAAEQCIKEGKGAIKWTRLSCRSFAANAVRLQLHALAYNLGNFMRTLAMPNTAEPWSLTSLREKLIKIGAKVFSHGRYVTFQNG